MVLSSGCVGPDIKHNLCFGLLLNHLKSSETHWLHADLTVSELTQRYEQQHLEAEWRSVLLFYDCFYFKMYNMIEDHLQLAEMHVCRLMSKKCMNGKALCNVPLCRYDLRIRYIPPNFMEDFESDRTTMLYFYQQVSVV